MGGYGSGRYSWRPRKRIIENCLSLPLSAFAEKGLALREGIHVHGELHWQSSDMDKDLAACGIEVNTLSGRTPGIRLHYTATSEGQARGETLDYWISLDATKPPVGGKRWWFVCPCGRRVGKLYLPRGERRFGCRHCYDLTYWSTLHSHRAEQLMRITGLSLQECKTWVRLERRGAWKTDHPPA
jgi:hypothetical protein